MRCHAALTLAMESPSTHHTTCRGRTQAAEPSQVCQKRYVCASRDYSGTVADTSWECALSVPSGPMAVTT